MRKLAAFAVAAIFGLGLATSPADAQQKPMGATGSSSPSMSSSTSPAKAAPAKKTAAKKSGSESVKALQTALNKNGAGLKVDGMMGKGTRDALKKYQSTNGLKVTGRVDAATKAKLGV